MHAAASAQLLQIKDESRVHKPDGAIALRVEPEEKTSIGDIKDRDFVKNYRTMLQYPLVRTNKQPVWFRFEVVNRTDASFFLEIKNPGIQSVDVFVLDQSGIVYHEVHMGSHVPVASRMVPHDFYYLPLDLPANAARTVFVRCVGNSDELFVPMYVGTLSAFYNRDQRHNLVQGVFLGLVLFIVLYNLFLFITIGKYEYLYFALFIACTGLLFFIINSYGFEFFTNRWTWIYRYMGIIAALAGIFMILYSSYFLKSRFTTPRRHIWLLSLAGIYLLAIVLNIFGKVFIALRFTEFNTAATLVFLLLVAITSWQRGYKPAAYYIIGLLVFAVGFSVYMMRQFGVLPVAYYDQPILQISSTLLMLILSLAMGKKIDEYIDKRNEARALALKASMENERLISHQNQVLETKVLERTKDLEQTVNTLQKQREELRNANQFKDKVFSVISHDMKSPLSTLGGFLNVLKINHLPEQEKEMILDKVQLALQNTRNLLDNILIWATKTDKAEPDARQFDLHTVVDEIFELFRLQADSKTISLDNNTPAPFRLYGNRNNVQLVLRNLISNAIKFTEHQGTVSVAAEETPEGVRILVQDNGVGIHPDILSKLFSDRHHITTRGTDNEKGTGIGLRLCKEYIEKQGGLIRVESQEGVGTTFIILMKQQQATVQPEYHDIKK
jgi:signal transduction histidine kinase